MAFDFTLLQNTIFAKLDSVTSTIVWAYQAAPTPEPPYVYLQLEPVKSEIAEKAYVEILPAVAIPADDITEQRIHRIFFRLYISSYGDNALDDIVAASDDFQKTDYTIEKRLGIQNISEIQDISLKSHNGYVTAYRLIVDLQWSAILSSDMTSIEVVNAALDIEHTVNAPHKIAMTQTITKH